MNHKDVHFMKQALSLARRWEGRTSPNPSVGALIVKNGEVISRGVHRGPGTLHAEAEALMKAGGEAKGATLFVTLEPCNHHGRTPPCTHAIVKSGITRVVYGLKDDNPFVEGGGADYLRDKGLKIDRCDPDGMVSRFYRPYRKFILQRMPFVTLKVALTLDGKLTLERGRGTVLSSPEALKFAHVLRARSDAVVVGAGTVRIDNPLLTIRKTPIPSSKRLLRVILDSRLRAPLNARVYSVEKQYPTLVFTSRPRTCKKVVQLERKGVEVISVKCEKSNIPVQRILRELGEKRGIMRLLVEGGEKVLAAFIEEKCFDELICIYSPVIAGKKGGDAFGILDENRERWQLREVKLLGNSAVLIIEP